MTFRTSVFHLWSKLRTSVLLYFSPCQQKALSLRSRLHTQSTICSFHCFQSILRSRSPPYMIFIPIIFISNKNYLKVARYSFSRPIPPKFEHKLRRHKQSFGKIAPTVVLDKDENLLWSGLQWHRSCHSNEMTLLPILPTEVFLGTGNCFSKIIHESFFLQ